MGIEFSVPEEEILEECEAAAANTPGFARQDEIPPPTPPSDRDLMPPPPVPPGKALAACKSPSSAPPIDMEQDPSDEDYGIISQPPPSPRPAHRALMPYAESPQIHIEEISAEEDHGDKDWLPPPPPSPRPSHRTLLSPVQLSEDDLNQPSEAAATPNISILDDGDDDDEVRSDDPRVQAALELFGVSREKTMKPRQRGSADENAMVQGRPRPPPAMKSPRYLKAHERSLVPLLPFQSPTDTKEAQEYRLKAPQFTTNHPRHGTTTYSRVPDDRRILLPNHNQDAEEDWDINEGFPLKHVQGSWNGYYMAADRAETQNYNNHTGGLEMESSPRFEDFVRFTTEREQNEARRSSWPRMTARLAFKAANPSLWMKET